MVWPNQEYFDKQTDVLDDTKNKVPVWASQNLPRQTTVDQIWDIKNFIDEFVDKYMAEAYSIGVREGIKIQKEKQDDESTD